MPPSAVKHALDWRYRTRISYTQRRLRKMRKRVTHATTARNAHPMAFNEVKECCKGHKDLAGKLQGESTNYIGKRHAMKIMSDAYGKGIARGQVENTNLRVYAKENDVTFAECFRTCQTETFYGREYVDMVQRINDRKTSSARQYSGRWTCGIHGNVK